MDCCLQNGKFIYKQGKRETRAENLFTKWDFRFTIHRTSSNILLGICLNLTKCYKVKKIVEISEDL